MRRSRQKVAQTKQFSIRGLGNGVAIFSTYQWDWDVYPPAEPCVEVSTSTGVMSLFLQAKTNSGLYNNGFSCAPEIFAYPKKVNWLNRWRIWHGDGTLQCGLWDSSFLLSLWLWLNKITWAWVHHKMEANFYYDGGWFQIDNSTGGKWSICTVTCIIASEYMKQALWYMEMSEGWESRIFFFLLYCHLVKEDSVLWYF